MLCLGFATPETTQPLTRQIVIVSPPVVALHLPVCGVFPFGTRVHDADRIAIEQVILNCPKLTPAPC